MTAPINHPLPLLELDVLRTFVAIADTGSFTVASNAVFRTPSAVSMQIKKLEEQLGRTVFTRDARSVSLTANGDVLLAYARQLLALNREAVSKFLQPEISGLVRIGTTDEVSEQLLPEILKRFAQTHPSIAVDVVVDQTARLQKSLDMNELDVTLTLGIPATGLAGNYLSNKEILFSEPIVWAGAKGGSAHMREPLPVALWEEHSTWRQLIIKRLLHSNRNYRIAYKSNHTAGQKAAVLADLVVAPLPRSMVGDGMVMLNSIDGLPVLGDFHIEMKVAADAAAVVLITADYIRQAYKEEGR